MPTPREILHRAVERAAQTSAAAYGRDWATMPERQRDEHRQLARRWAEFLNLEAGIATLSTIATRQPVEQDGNLIISAIDGETAQQFAAETLTLLADGPPADDEQPDDAAHP